MAFSGRNLTCTRGGRTVFRDLTFDVEAGAALLLRGPNGSGKSSLLRMAAGFLPPAAGHFAWDGKPAVHDDLRARVAWVGHADATKAAFTVAENAAFWIRLGGGDSSATGRALASMGIDHLADLPAGVLSAGQRRRLNLTRLAASTAPLWLLDEPTSSLDDASVTGLLAILQRHLDHGGAIVVATHVDLPLRPSVTLSLGASR